MLSGACSGVKDLFCKKGGEGFYYAAVVDGPGFPLKGTDPGMMDKIIAYCKGWVEDER